MIGWVAVDHSEVKRISRYLRVRGEAGTVDELAFGWVTDELAKLIFPAFTTLMTRARYFIFLTAVFQLAADLAWRKAVKKHGEDALGNPPGLQEEFLKLCKDNAVDIETAICFALSRTETAADEDSEEDEIDEGEVEEDEVDETDVYGIIGIRNMNRKTRKKVIPSGELFRERSRYPNALYFSGAKRLGAFQDEIDAQDDVWLALLKEHMGERDQSPWNNEWKTKCEACIEQVRAIYFEFDRLRDKNAPPEEFTLSLSLDLSESEAELLRSRLAIEVENKRVIAMGSVAKDVFAAFLNLDAEMKSGSEGFRVLAKKTSGKARAALLAAADFIDTVQPAIQLYTEMRRAASKGVRGFEATVVKAASEIDYMRAVEKLPHFKRNWALATGKSIVPQGIEKWVDEWLAKAIKAKTNQDWRLVVIYLIERETRIIEKRYKKPRFAFRGGRIRPEPRAKNEKYDDRNPGEARLSAGRLDRALQIFSDIQRKIA